MAELPSEVDAAFEELAIPRDLPPGDLRRAYLRVVKVRRPETDPVGFRKAREAFDLLTGWFAHLASLPVEEPAPAANDVPLEPPAPAAPLEGWDRLRPLLAENSFAEARRLICELLEAKVQPPNAQLLLMIILDLQHKDPGPQARPVLQAFLRWIDRARLELTFASQPERWLLVKAIASLPPETPLEVERLVVLGVLENSLETALPAIEAFTRAHPAESDAAILPLSEASPLLHQLLTPYLNIELIKARESGGEPPMEQEPERPASSSSRAPAWLLLFVVTVMLRAFTSNNSCLKEPTYDELAYPTGPYVRPGSALPPKQFFVVDDSSLLPTPLKSPMEELCTLSFDDCAAAKSVEWSLNAGRCAEARAGHAKLSESATLDTQGPAARSLQGILDTLSLRLPLCRTP